MPLFAINDDRLSPVPQSRFHREKELQTLVESNLEVIFNCRFVATEFSTGSQHSGRIDTLALSEDNNPVIIEYKKEASSQLITQSLYYLHWIQDHQGDFHLAAQERLGVDVEVDFSDIRVICIAPGYRKYDLHAVQVMGANLELWTYRRFGNDTLYFEEVFQSPDMTGSSRPVEIEPSSGKNPVMVEAGRKAAITRKTGSYTWEEHLEGKPPEIIRLAELVRDYVMSLDPAIEENPKKRYIGFRTSQNIVCMAIQKKQMILWLKLDPSSIETFPQIARDVRGIGHAGTGDLEITIGNEDDFEIATEYIERAWQNIGG